MLYFFRQEVSQDLSSSPASEVNTKILADLENDRTSMTSEGSRTDEQCRDMENRQPDINQNGVYRQDSLSSSSSGNISPGPAFTSFHGLNIIADSMAQEGEGNPRLSFELS